MNEYSLTRNGDVILRKGGNMIWDAAETPG